ncbi:hypothetical protein VTN49DRAFT_3598 [Thermomyces lanuginosus]|uniref:uncharacterized protein n=1 Tax=Thermomyces lanuginosus TaxID=5541 RepID=UPI003742AA88
MAKDKERAINPALAQRKLEKQRALKKSKAEALARRNEKLARRNPERIQRQINEIKAIEESGQPLRPREKQILEELERDLRAVQKARAALGDKAPQFGKPQQDDKGKGGNVLGKRRREGQQPQAQWREDSDSSETDEEVRNIPMPRDTPPPIPPRRRRSFGEAAEEHRGPHPLPPKPDVPVESKTVYEAAPVIRDLRKEATSKFVPATVRMKQESIKGQGRLLEPEEMDRLEQAGYVPSAQPVSGTPSQQREPQRQQGSGTDPTEEDPEDILKQIEAETRAPGTRNVTVEEVSDEDA